MVRAEDLVVAYVPEMLAVTSAATEVVVTGKVAVVAPAATETLAGI
jgi:hypothetical protein